MTPKELDVLKKSLGDIKWGSGHAPTWEDIAERVDGAIAAIEFLEKQVAQLVPGGHVVVPPLRYTFDGALAECPCCGSLDVGGAHSTVHCYRCGLSITKEGPLANAIAAWNLRGAPLPASSGPAPEREFIAAHNLAYELGGTEDGNYLLTPDDLEKVVQAGASSGPEQTKLCEVHACHCGRQAAKQLVTLLDGKEYAASERCALNHLLAGYPIRPLTGAKDRAGPKCVCARPLLWIDPTNNKCRNCGGVVGTPAPAAKEAQEKCARFNHVHPGAPCDDCGAPDAFSCAWRT